MELKQYKQDKDDVKQVFKNKRGESFTSSASSRFHNDYARRQYGRILTAEENILESYNNPHTALISLTGSPFNEISGWRAPCDYLNDLLESWGNVTGALRRSMDDRRWSYVAVVGASKNGYAHIHIGVYVDGSVSIDDFENAIDAHCRNSPVAKKSHHPYEEAIKVKRVTEKARGSESTMESGLSTGMGKYIASHLPALEEDIEDAERHVRQHAAVLWASETRHLRMSKSFSHMYNNGDSSDGVSPDSDWEYIGVEIDGEVYDVEADDRGGGSRMVEIESRGYDEDPVPWAEVD